MGASFVVGKQYNRHRGGTAAVRGNGLSLESGEVLLNTRSERVVESA